MLYRKIFLPRQHSKNFPAAVLALDKINHLESFGPTKDSKLTLVQIGLDGISI
ncbi:MAG: hypothetical protein Ct9H300mP18_07140 [Candidatus Neomarinimicrobiota bacterium]|nr:MAG: hypothetical protein Ct9H300mP18_07140 [Candidatus Neomarinimicrobiota bacterium]